jgi:hypothetical protein
MFFTKVFYGYVKLCETIIGVALRLDHSCVAKLLSAWVVGVFHEFPRFCSFRNLACCQSVVLLCLTCSFLVFGFFSLCFLLSFLGSLSGSSLSIDLLF